MTEAVIVSTARTPIGKAYQAARSTTPKAPTLAGPCHLGGAVSGPKIEPGEVEDVVMGCAMQQGTTVHATSRARR